MHLQTEERTTVSLRNQQTLLPLEGCDQNTEIFCDGQILLKQQNIGSYCGLECNILKNAGRNFAGENNLKYPFGHGWTIDESSILTFCTTLFYCQLIF